MITCLDDFHTKTYHPTEYNCSHFLRDVWLFLKGVDIGPMVGAFNSGDLRTAMESRKDLVAMDDPIDPSIAWFVTHANDPPHVGVYMEGRIFHMTPEGPRIQDLSFVAAQYKKVKFYDA